MAPACQGDWKEGRRSSWRCSWILLIHLGLDLLSHIVALVWVERGQIDFVSHENHLYTAYGFRAGGVSAILSLSDLVEDRRK